MQLQNSFVSSVNTRLKRLVLWVFLLIGPPELFATVNGTKLVGQLPRTQLTDTTKNAYSTDKRVIDTGRLLFETNCSACHNFRQKGIGPNLAQATTENSPAWLKKFIRNAAEPINQGDARAVRLLKEYNQYMPAFPTLKDADLEALLAYIQANQKRTPISVKNENLGPVLKDPITDKPVKSGLRLQLSQILTAPATATTSPLARINTMRVLPGTPDRVTPDRAHPDRAFIQDLRGKLYEMVDTTLRVFMDMASERAGFIDKPGLATGLGSFAFHPDFYRNGLFYTTHTEKAGAAPADFAYPDSIKVTLQWVITEWKVRNPSATVFAGTGRELFRVNMVSSIHGVQEITFNPLARPGSPDYGLLYIGIGDGGATENGFSFLCRDKSHIWSSVLRIDPKGRNSKNGRYGIPASNPYARADARTTCREVYCRGFRNPNRIIWAPDGKMLITDIGQTQIEELNIGKAGADYGWPAREGTFLINTQGSMSNVYALPTTDKALGYVYPVMQYDHGEGNAISGGFVYAGTQIPRLRGKYIFGDIVNGRVFYVDSKALVPGQQAPVYELELEIDRDLTTFQQRTNAKKTDLRIGMGINNDLYLYTKTDGKVYKVIGCERH